MSTTVKSRPTHYDVLGLTPGATADEIAKAFANELRRPRPFGSLAEVTVAYETLRDRIKREAYDVSLGLKPKPASPPPAAPEWSSYSMRASASPAPQSAKGPSPRAVPKADPPPRAEARPEPKVSPFVAAASPGEPTNADFREARPKPSEPVEQLRRPEAAVKPRLDHSPGGDLLHFDEAQRFRFDRAELSQWKLPALGAGALILAVTVGAWTGLEAGNDNEQALAENSVTMKVPAAKPLPEIAGSPLTIPPSEAEVEPQQPRRPAATPAGVERARQPLQNDLPDTQDETAQSSLSELSEVGAEQATDESQAIQATAAKLPLPNAVIARTIGRIGYPCGQVVSTTSMDGAPGTFKVTCTSGHSYRASPVRGRYRFRRLG